MNLRAPAYPLITVDPYFSIWSMADRLYDDTTRLWTGASASMSGTARVDGIDYIFMGSAAEMGKPVMQQTGVDVTTFTTVYTFEAAGIRLTASFTTPTLPDDLEIMSRPVSYLHVAVCPTDGREHDVQVTVCAADELCLQPKMQNVAVARAVPRPGALRAMCLGGIEQPVLGRSGDDIGIDWGYFYLAVDGGALHEEKSCGHTFLIAEASLSTAGRANVLFMFAYDDVYSLKYFGHYLKAYWKREGREIEEVIWQAFVDYPDIMEKCGAFHEKLEQDAKSAGGEKYADLLILALRQVMAAHKLTQDPEGRLLFVSKECRSNGCAATVDVSYPSIPLFLLYNPSLIKGMLRPVFRYASSEAWPFPFAPHDVGTYPILNGQVYSEGTNIAKQMPVEECGNMLLMVSAITAAEKSTEFAAEHRTLLHQWADYLVDFGADPNDQLCTDDFAGHLAHNCNLALKTIMALAAYAEVCERMQDKERAERYRRISWEMASTWRQQAMNADGSFRLAFDRPDSFSLKYNAVWDKVFGLGLFPAEMWEKELAGYLNQMNPYGVPLDNRADYTKSDWTVWAATLAEERSTFDLLVGAVWRAYQYTPSRVPMCDWYSTITSLQVSFQHRSVQGGLFIQLLNEKKICRLI